VIGADAQSGRDRRKGRPRHEIGGEIERGDDPDAHERAMKVAVTTSVPVPQPVGGSLALTGGPSDPPPPQAAPSNPMSSARNPVFMVQHSAAAALQTMENVCRSAGVCARGV
jgi:hypothetical protein